MKKFEKEWKKWKTLENEKKHEQKWKKVKKSEKSENVDRNIRAFYGLIDILTEICKNFIEMPEILSDTFWDIKRNVQVFNSNI